MKIEFVFFLHLFILFSSLSVHADSFPKKYQLAICAVFQDENFFLKEWLEFHKLMGVEHFYLYNHLSSDNYREILAPYIDSGDVELIDWPLETRNEKEYLNIVQLPAYNHALAIATTEAQWIAFIDLDEFLFPVECSSLTELLDDYKGYAGLSVNWQIYGTSWLNSLPPNGLITENLILKAPVNYDRNQLIKMIVQPQFVESIRNVHFFVFKSGFYAQDGSGRVLPPGIAGQPVNIAKVRINHYWCGTYEWLIKEKIPRRQKWGIQFSEELLHDLLSIYNRVEDRSILRFVPCLKERLSRE